MTAETGQSSAYVPSQDERTLACISHLTIFVSSIGLLVAVGLWIYLQRRHPYAAFQAGQAVIFQFMVMILTFVVIGIWLAFFFGVLGIGLIASSGAGGEIAFGAAVFIGIMVFLVIILVLTLGMYGYAIYAAVRSYQSRPFRIPVVGILAEMISPMPPVQREEMQQ